MALLKNPSEINDNVIVKGLIYGQPGTGKSTLALSAPNPVMIDSDKGMRRVEKRFQVPSLPLDTYESLLALMEGNELDPFDTIVFDTLGKLIDRIADYLVRTNPKAKQGDGSLSQKGWGYLKGEFQKLLKLAEKKNKHMIFVAHEREEKDGDIRIVRADVVGSSGKEIVKELDFMGYVQMRGDKRTISFTPSESHYAKNSLRLPPFLEIPTLTAQDHKNDFIDRVIVQGTKAKLKEDQAMAESYNAMIETITKKINASSTAKELNSAKEVVLASQPIWDSEIRLKLALMERAKAAGVEFDKTAKSFVEPKQMEAAE